MKKLSLITKISIIIFLFIMALVLSIPVYKRLETIVDKYTEKFCEQIKDTTGLTVSYDSISPSVLAYLGIKGIKAIDGQGRVIAEVKNTHIKYKLMPLLKGEYNSIIRGVSINGVNVDIPALIDFVNEFTAANGPPAQEENEKPPQWNEQIYDKIQMVMDYIPPNVTVKNLNLEYNKKPLNASLLVKEIRVLNPANKNSIDFNIKSSVSAVYNKINVTGEAAFNGSVMQELDNSFVNINLANISQGSYKLNKLNFILDLLTIWHYLKSFHLTFSDIS